MMLAGLQLEELMRPWLFAEVYEDQKDLSA